MRKTYLSKRKGQIFSLDFLSAVFIFMLVFGVLLLSWNSVLDDSAKDSERKDMELFASRIANFMVSSGGHPSNWHESPANVTSIGIVSTDRVVDQDKLMAFVSMDYDLAREKLVISNYNFKFALVSAGIELGSYNYSGPAAFARRAVMYQGKPDMLEITVWRY